MHLGAYGNPIVHTPNLDGLAKDGLVFDRAYVSQSACSPSRASILSGSYPHENGMMGLVTSGFNITPGTPLLSKELADRGYFVASLGKFHMGDAKTLGFEASWGPVGEPPRRFGARFEKLLSKRGKRPFFLLAGLTDAHAPFKKDLKGSPRTKVDCNRPAEALMGSWFPRTAIPLDEYSRLVCGYYHEINRLDESVGELLSVLKKQGLDRNTITIFLSDNGPSFRRSKMTLFEAGVNVPLIIRYPNGDWLRGVRSDELVSFVDLAPTLMDVLSLEAPSTFSGQSLLPLLRGEKYRPRRSEVFVEYTTHEPQMFAPSRGVITGRYKLIHNLVRRPKLDRAIREANKMLRWQSAAPEFSLYDLTADPHEVRRLRIEKHPDLFEDLRRRIVAWQDRTHDPYRDDDFLVRDYLARLEETQSEHVIQYRDPVL